MSLSLKSAVAKSFSNNIAFYQQYKCKGHIACRLGVVNCQHAIASGPNLFLNFMAMFFFVFFSLFHYKASTFRNVSAGQ